MKAIGILNILSLREEGGNLVGEGNVKRTRMSKEYDFVELVYHNKNGRDYLKPGIGIYFDGELVMENGRMVVYFDEYMLVTNNAFYKTQAAPAQSGTYCNGKLRGTGSFGNTGYSKNTASSPATGGYTPQPRVQAQYSAPTPPPAYTPPQTPPPAYAPPQTPPSGYAAVPPSVPPAYVPPHVPPQAPPQAPPVSNAQPAQPAAPTGYTPNPYASAPNVAPDYQQQENPMGGAVDLNSLNIQATAKVKV